MQDCQAGHWGYPFRMIICRCARRNLCPSKTPVLIESQRGTCALGVDKTLNLVVIAEVGSAAQ
jgi:hypothetical protein